MLSISVSKKIIDAVMLEAKSAGNQEIAGLLIGRVVENAIIIDSSVTGRTEAGPRQVILPGETIAKIADDILGGRIRGNIVGWYHSHPGYGVFMSATDTEAQKKLQQLSAYVTAMIIEPSTDEVGFFTLDASGAPTPISSNHIDVFGEGEEPVSPRIVREIPTTLPPVIEPFAPVRPPRARRYLLITIFLVAVLAGGSFLAIFLLPDKTPPTIQHDSFVPIPGGWSGTPLELKVLAEVQSKSLFPAAIAAVKLYYRPANESTARAYETQEARRSGGAWIATIPRERVLRDIEYYFSASTTAGIESKTSPYYVRIADFELRIAPEKTQILAGKKALFLVTLTPINHFESPRVVLNQKRSSGLIDIKWDLDRNIFSVSLGRKVTTNLVVEAKPRSYGDYALTISAQSESITHNITRDFAFKITVPTFEATIAPAIISVSRTANRTGTALISVESLYGDIGNVTWGPPTLKNSQHPPELPYGVLPEFSVTRRWVSVGKSRVENISLSFTVATDTPTNRYEITLHFYADLCPDCTQDVTIVLEVK